MKKIAFFLITLLGPFSAFEMPSFAEDAPTPAASVPSACESILQYEVLKKDSPKPILMDDSIVSAQGTSEDLAKESLSKLIVAKKAQVLEACRQQYENSAACMSTKLGSYGSNIKSLSFAARKELEDSINDDCKKRSATCGAVTTTEPKCKQVILAVPTPEADAKKADKGKAKK